LIFIAAVFDMFLERIEAAEAGNGEGFEVRKSDGAACT